MFEFIKDINNYEDRKVARTQVKDLIVSTVFSSDEGYETAIIDDNVYPVERYKTKEEAIKGHEEWCKKAETITEITMLGGFGGLVEDRKIILKRKS